MSSIILMDNNNNMEKRAETYETQLEERGDPDEIMQVMEHPRMKRERETVKFMGESTDYRPEDRSHVPLTLDTISMGMVGKSKNLRHTSTIGRTVGTLGGSCVRGVFGQDAAFSEIYRDEERDMTALVGIIADGHGQKGEDASRMCIEGLQRSLLTPTRMRLLIDMLVLGESVAIREEIQSCFLSLDEEVCDAVELGGSTLTVFMVLHDHLSNRIFVVTSNVGDSPLLLIRTSDGKVGEMTTPHSWDSINERQVHIKASRQAGRKIPDVIYSRWNTENRRTIADVHGLFRPIPMFRGNTDEIDEINRQHVIKTMRLLGKRPGGIQSRVRKLQKVQRRGSISIPTTSMSTTSMSSSVPIWEDDVMEGTGHENFGSTPLEINEITGEMTGGPQMTRSLGERRYKRPLHDRVPLLTSIPSVSILECWGGVSTQFSVVAFSDGPGDALYHSEFGEKTKEYFDMHKRDKKEGNAQGLADQLFKAVQEEGSFFFGTPRWDDMSMICTTFTIQPLQG
uniref:PPM-type phosphatase domain-containing protein n=1 Tax=viral metagenome TaxID=1070528 RepID=A0A6C0D0C9_9ZZZZ